MRVWDLPPQDLCRRHLLGQHNEIHGIWTVITQQRSGYARHPEVMRWRPHLRKLWERHEATAAEMARRGYQHRSPLPQPAGRGEHGEPAFVDPPDRQRDLLRAKGCECRTS